MRNVFQARTGVEAAIVRNLLVANGIDSMVNRMGFTFIGTACSEVWVQRDEDGERAIKLVRQLYSRGSVSEYRGSRALGVVLRLVGLASIILGSLQLLAGVFPGERIATSLVFIVFGVFLYGQGNIESGKSNGAPSQETAVDLDQPTR
jgi:hypothetical protein